MDTTWVWGLLLDGVAFAGVLLLVSKRRTGWLVSLLSQVLWAIYAIQTKQWGFFPGIICYSIAAVRGYIKWRKPGGEHHCTCCAKRPPVGQENRGSFLAS